MIYFKVINLLYQENLRFSIGITLTVSNFILVPPSKESVKHSSSPSFLLLSTDK